MSICTDYPSPVVNSCGTDKHWLETVILMIRWITSALSHIEFMQ